MAAINNLRGKITKDYDILYEEKLSDKLYFVVVQMYKDSCLFIDCIITNGNKIQWSNGVISYEDSSIEIETQTKDGYRVYTVNKHGTNRVLVDVPKEDMLKWLV